MGWRELLVLHLLVELLVGSLLHILEITLQNRWRLILRRDPSVNRGGRHRCLRERKIVVLAGRQALVHDTDRVQGRLEVVVLLPLFAILRCSRRSLNGASGIVSQLFGHHFGGTQLIALLFQERIRHIYGFFNLFYSFSF